MNYHNMNQKTLFESYIAPPTMISRCYSSKANAFPTLHGNSVYLGDMRHFNRKNAPFGNGHLKMPPLDRAEPRGPLVKIVGGFVGSKSQAGSNHRGREVSLWDVIVDKIIETMENPEPQRKSADAKKNGRIPKIPGFTMIGVGQFSPDCPNGSGFDCLSTNWYPSSPDVPEMGVFREHNTPPKGHLAQDSNPVDGFIPETDIAAYCRNKDRTFGIFKDSSTSQEALPSSNQTCSLSCASDCLTSHQLVENGPGDLETLLCDVCDVPENPETTEDAQSSSSKSSLSPVADSVAPKHVLRPEAAEFTPKISCRPSVESESEDDTLLSSSCDSQSPCDITFLRPRVQRTLSECSVDSDDSFIVFESAEDDPVVDSEESDGEDSCSEEDLDEIDNPILFPHNLEFSQPSPVLSRIEEANKKWTENYSDVNPTTAASSSKKVKFAEGADLVKVKHLIAWDFAHRAARIGPWEMYHRDGERFKSRISALSSVISPVLAKRHREKIYSERFQT